MLHSTVLLRDPATFEQLDETMSQQPTGMKKLWSEDRDAKRVGVAMGIAGARSRQCLSQATLRGFGLG